MSKKNIDKVLSELLSNQLKKVDSSKKFDYSDIVRLTKYIDKSIFSKDNCVLWKGYITNFNKKEKGPYINFFFKKKKYALHRLLYINYIGPLYDDEYLKFTCENRGCCCNINHISKFRKNDDKPKDISDTKNKLEKNNKISEPKIDKNDNTVTNLLIDTEIDFIVDFE
jgi:hypothetical protein